MVLMMFYFTQQHFGFGVGRPLNLRKAESQVGSINLVKEVLSASSRDGFMTLTENPGIPTIPMASYIVQHPHS